MFRKNIVLTVALLLVACRSATPTEIPTPMGQLLSATASSIASQPQNTTVPAPTMTGIVMDMSTEVPAAQPSPSPIATQRPSPAASLPPITPIFQGDLATAHLVFAYFSAYNTGQLDAALAFLSDDIQIGDCDFQANEPISLHGKQKVAQWLGQRIADHDQFVVRGIIGVDPKVDFSHDAVGVDFARRTSDTLQRLGYLDGITRNVGAKVLLKAPDHKLINTLALGPGFDSTFTCYSYFGMTALTR